LPLSGKNEKNYADLRVDTSESSVRETQHTFTSLKSFIWNYQCVQKCCTEHTCSSSCTEAARGRPSATLAIIVINTIVTVESYHKEI